MKILKIAFTISLLVSSVACNKKKKNGGSSAPAAVTSYYMNNGQCYNNLNQAVAMTYCQNISGLPGGGYPTTGTYGQLINGQCYLNGQIVNMSYCQQTQYPTQTGNSGQCIGWYYVYTNFGYMEYYCSGFDCRGYTLYNLYGTPQYCQ